MLSLHTNAANIRIQNSINKTQQQLGTSATRLGTGFRINSAKDDAAGLRMATRLEAQTKGMMAASSNTQNAISMLQTADGAFDELAKILMRMKDLATQSADASYTDTERLDMQAEYDALGHEVANVMNNTAYGGQKLLTPSGGAGGASGLTAGKLAGDASLTFQIGATEAETMTFSVSGALSGLHEALKAASNMYLSGGVSGGDISGADGARAVLEKLNTALDSIGEVRSKIGGVQNRLQHTDNNLRNMITNTSDAKGRVMDVDYAAESANNAKLNILQQAGGSMLKQSNQMSQLVLSLLQ
ncbi:flagellin [Pandoraea pulmonicola]|uniref:Flagellin n=1 Tax=Pandoraea pulmonicola TaxID=93221 RepID=A0AAJ4ZB62_PANPU|nr:flagellin [Pandoraea pulmonicola]AJC21203.1 hypothetical protein RO07_13240 [Pandoraea pulmonicola]SUA90118.1 Flagellin [Pandoraea pulmonicola]